MVALRFFCLLIFILLSHPVKAIIPESERNALIQIGTFADPMLQLAWAGSIGSECNWYGVTCDANQTHIIRLALLPYHQEFVTLTTPEVTQLLFLESLSYDNECSTPFHCLSATELNALQAIY